ncbi:MAG: hypothetical protein GY928_12155 [Colwellia sp.]|nr:hypothetical protein [Colwellia sp.]
MNLIKIIIALLLVMVSEVSYSKINEDCKKDSGWFSGTQNIDMYGDRYVLLNSTSKFELDTNLFNVTRTVRFYTDNQGYVGKDSTDIFGDASLDIFFNVRGKTDVSSEISNTLMDDWCIYKEVSVHYSPTVSEIENNLQHSGDRFFGSITVSGTIDESYSKYGESGQGIIFFWEKKHVSYWTGSRCDVIEESAAWEHMANTSNSIDVDYYSCDTRFRVKTYDGTYYSNLRELFVPGRANSGGSGGSCTGSLCDDEP